MKSITSKFVSLNSLSSNNKLFSILKKNFSKITSKSSSKKNKNTHTSKVKSSNNKEIKEVNPIKKEIESINAKPISKVDKLFSINMNEYVSKGNSLFTAEEREKAIKTLKFEVENNPVLFNDLVRNSVNKEGKTEKEIEEDIANKKNIIKENLENSPKRNKGYFTSLLNKYKIGYDVKLEDEKLENNEKFFKDAYQTTGPRYMMSREEINKVHESIDLAMRQLEDLGLSKEELLFDIPKGIPLRQDQFFQFIKNNRKAREMLIQPTEEFSVETVIEKALKQDLGPDPSIGVGKKEYDNPQNLNDLYFKESDNKQFKKTYHDKMVDEDSYYYKENKEFKNHVYLNYLNSKPITFIKPPLSRSERRRKHMLWNITKEDLHWKNVAVLSKFLNLIGGIVSRHQSRLPLELHRRMVKNIKYLRSIGIFPSHDVIKPSDKMPLTSIHHLFIEDVTKSVDPRTGKIKEKPIKEDLVDPTTYSKYNSAKEAYEAAKEHQMRRLRTNPDDLIVDTTEFPDVKHEEARKYLLAQNYLRRLENNAIDFGKMNEFDLEQKSAFEEYYSKIISNSNISNITENYISEKGYLIDELLGGVNKEEAKINNNNKGNVNLVGEIANLNSSIEKLISKYISPLDSHVPKDKFIFDPNFNDNLFDREKNDGNNYIVSQLKEPSLKQGVKHGRFKFKSYKTERNFEKNNKL